MALVEAETDTAVMTFNGFPALGVPGKTNWKAEWAELLKGLMVFVWQEPGAEEFAEDIAASLPDVMRVIAPSMAKDPCELAQLTGDGFSEVMSDLLDQANAVRESDERTVGAEIESYLSTQGQLFIKQGWRSVWKTLESKKEVLTREMPRTTDAQARQWRNFRDCGTRYNLKKCRHLGEQYAAPFHCQDPSICAFCSRAAAEQFWRSKDGLAFLVNQGLGFRPGKRRNLYYRCQC